MNSLAHTVTASEVGLSRFALTAAEMAAAFEVSPQSIRKKLRSFPGSGKRTVAGNAADTWGLADLPAELCSRLERKARSTGYPTVAEMFEGGFKAKRPPVPLAEISDECLTAADKLKQALLPSLRRRRFVLSQADFAREGVMDYKKVFGFKISTRTFRGWIKRIVERDNGLENWEKLELYLPKKPKRKRELPESPEQFPGLVYAINAGASPDEIWKKAFEMFADRVKAGKPRNRVARQLRAFLSERAPSLAQSPDALRKAFARKLERWQSAESFDKRACNKHGVHNGAEDGELVKQIKSLAWFLPAAEFFYLLTNRTKDSGSVPEAIRRVISLPNLPAGWTDTIKRRFLKKVGLKKIVPACPDDLRETILARQKAGQPLVPAGIAKAIRIKVPLRVIEAYRRPHEAELNNLQCPGTMTMVRRHGCEPQFARAGDILEADDGSINFPVCIPWTSPTGGLITETPCSARYGVIVGRFQWLRTIDVATRFRPGWVFVARSRGGFRGADVLTLMHGITVQHGVWEQYRFEQGVFKSNLVKRAIELIGSRLHTVFSPHSKPFIEGGFNQDWTKLSVHFPQCDIGRYRGDTEEANKVVQSCRRGAADPRRYFPMLKDAMAAFEEITKEENGTLVKSRNSGQWVPEERWQRETGDRALRKLDEASLFMFAPYAIEWQVKGMLVGGRVPIFDDMSVPFDFTAPWLPEYSGARMRLHFDPTAPKCVATPVLLQAWNGHRAGEVLPPLTQVNETTGYIRMVLNWGEDSGTAGRKAKQQAQVAVRREVRTVMAGGRGGYSRSEVKALDATGIIERDYTGKATVPDGKAVSESRIVANLSETQPNRATRIAAQMAEIEKFEREHQHLLV